MLPGATSIVAAIRWFDLARRANPTQMLPPYPPQIMGEHQLTVCASNLAALLKAAPVEGVVQFR